MSREGLEERAKSRQNLCCLYAQRREVYEDLRQTFRHLVLLDSCPSIVSVKQIFELKFVVIFLPINLNMCCGCSKKTRLIETVLLSTHSICFG